MDSLVINQPETAAAAVARPSLLCSDLAQGRDAQSGGKPFIDVNGSVAVAVEIVFEFPALFFAG
jgi:hypothetical protein